MNNSQIRYEIFLKVAELGNITLAADALSYTQSGVSHAIAAMEREAGCTLFHRSKTGVTLTESGKALLPLVQDLINKQHSLDQAMDALSNRVAGVLRLGSFTSFTAIWMAKLIRDFTNQFSEVKIELTNGTYRDIENGITEGRLDCGFLTSPNASQCENRVFCWSIVKSKVIVLFFSMNSLYHKRTCLFCLKRLTFNCYDYDT